MGLKIGTQKKGAEPSGKKEEKVIEEKGKSEKSEGAEKFENKIC